MRSNFIGQYHHALDPKNRLFIPQRFREELLREGKDYFIVTSGPEGCLSMYLPSEWDQFLAKLEDMKLPNKAEQRAVKRAILAKASEAQVDSQGRILVPQHLVGAAGLKKDVFVIGAGSKVELWDRQRYLAYEKKSQKTIAKASKELDL